MGVSGDSGSRRDTTVAPTMQQWIDATRDHRRAASADTTAVTRQYLNASPLNDVTSVGDSLIARRSIAGDGAPTILIVGDHSLDGLAPAGQLGPSISSAGHPAAPGLGSRLAGFVAAIEGACHAPNGSPANDVNLLAVSTAGGDGIDGLLDSDTLASIPAVFMTSGIAWSQNPTVVTFGARGCLTFSITASSERAVPDAIFAGATRNPLNRLTEVIGELRDARGRITIPGFYDRAQAPQRREVSGAANEWLRAVGLIPPPGDIPALERATRWPLFSVLDISADGAVGGVAPGTASATLRLYLVPEQQPHEIRQALEAWINERSADDVRLSLSVIRESAPYQLPLTSAVASAQLDVATSGSRTSATPVLAGGPLGAGEVAAATGAPVGFLSLCGPEHGCGTMREVVPSDVLDRAISRATATFERLGGLLQARSVA